MGNTKLQIRPVTGNVGAEIANIDLSTPQPDSVYQDLKMALAEFGVIFFRDQKLDSDQYVALAKRFGRPSLPNSGIIPALAGSGVIAEVKKEPGAERNVGGSWHTDQAYRKEPSWATMLLARQVPEFGGDTLFASMSAAYQALSPSLKQTLETLRGVNSNAEVQARMKTGRAPEPDAIHPVVIRHPLNGKRILYVNPAYTVRFEGWTAAESKPLLDTLFQHCQRPEFFCRFRWQEGSLAFWDNFHTWHYAVNDYVGGDRLMHRIVVEGPPFT
ncbi:TauD/TfdA family dioxygenase [soil metagenome]